MIQRFALLFTLIAILATALGAKQIRAQDAQDDPLHQAFLDPPRDYSPMPFWFWNGKMEGPKIQEQIRQMVEQHVYGAFLHARDGLQTPYLSEDWFKAFGAGLEEAKRSGFEFNFVDEYDWPSGEVRNVWMTGNHQSEVLARHPEFRMKTLAYKVHQVEGPGPVELPAFENAQAVVAARMLDKNRIDETSLQLLEPDVRGGPRKWQAPAGKWSVVQFYLEPAMGFDGGFVDLMNPEAMKVFIDLSYGQYYSRFASYFGKTIRYSFADHEGDYGYRIAWTPALFQTFEQRTGYDLRKFLPLLIYDGGNRTTKVRSDYLATVTQLYYNSFWEGITKHAAGLGIGRTGHGWEESLQWAAALEGSQFQLERGLNPVGVDSLFDFGRQALNFKVAQSVADFEGRRFMCENQGVQGTDSYLDMEGIRRGTNAIGLWGVNLFVFHAVNYDTLRTNYPPDWLHQPYWPNFHIYADYTRRISYMNSESHHVANVLLYYPITTLWANSRPLFSTDMDYQRNGDPDAWHNVTTMVNDYYTRLILRMADRQWDYDVADDHYLEQARLEGNELVIGPQRFRAIVIPPITSLSRTTLNKILAFYQAGGTVIGLRLLPGSSPEAGDNDAEIKSGIDRIFGAGAGSTPLPYTEQRNSADGRADFVSESVETLIDRLDASLPKDVTVVAGPASNLMFEHNQKLGRDYYWLVNDSDRPRTNQVILSAKGVPEKWDAVTGGREQLYYVNRPDGTEVRLNFAPWDAYYVTFQPSSGTEQKAELVSTNAETLDHVARQGNSISVHVAAPATLPAVQVSLREGGRLYKGEASTGQLQTLPLSGKWQFRPRPDRIQVLYAKVNNAAEGVGEKRGWMQDNFDDAAWPELWLSSAQGTIRDWEMIGPFANPDNNGFAEAYPPEKEFDPSRQYQGQDGQLLSWKRYYGNEPHLALGKWNIWMETEGGRFSDSSYIAQFDPLLLTQGKSWILSYAHAYLYSPRDQRAQFIVAADNWSKVWLNHKLVFENLRTPFWYELNDNWADRMLVDLHAGWNEVLVKVGKARSATELYGFTFRVADESGRTLHDVFAGLAPYDVKGSPTEDTAMRWYRIEVPPGVVAVVPPALHQSYRMLVNGKELKTGASTPIDISGALVHRKNTLVVVAHEQDPLDSPLEFVSGDTPFALTPWTKTGLVNFSGTAIYTKNFNLPESFSGKQLTLDLGRVSSVAEVYVNGQSAGTLVWNPYRLNITKLVKPGENQVKILVTNTEANRRAVGTWRRILPQIDRCGLEGPVQIVPYVDETITLKAAAE